MVTAVAVLFARADSHYKTLPKCDVWDAERDARRWPGGAPVVAHPPCRAWGNLRHFAKPRPDEKDLARWAVQRVREFGGVLEHPARSTLWADQGLPLPGQGKDAFGGWTFPVLQLWWGHRAEKATWLYIVGCEPTAIPSFQLRIEPATCVVEHMGKAERERTPTDFAHWLVELASRCKR